MSVPTCPYSLFGVTHRDRFVRIEIPAPSSEHAGRTGVVQRYKRHPTPGEGGRGEHPESSTRANTQPAAQQGGAGGKTEGEERADDAHRQ